MICVLYKFYYLKVTKQRNSDPSACVLKWCLWSLGTRECVCLMKVRNVVLVAETMTECLLMEGVCLQEIV